MKVASYSSAQTIEEYFKLFPFKPDFVQFDSLDEHVRINTDIKNAYVSVAYDDADYGYEYGGELQFTYFLTTEKKKIFGYSEYFDGPSSANASVDFYSYDQGRWTRVAVLPQLDLTNFDSTSALVEKVGSDYRIRYALPQHGTDIAVTVFEVGENDAPFNYDEYVRFIRSLPSITLSWNRDKALFEITKD